MKFKALFRWQLLLATLTFLATTCPSIVYAQYYNTVPAPTRTPPRPSPRICQPGVLRPAIECGCWGYSRLYVALDQWQRLEELCLDIVGGTLSFGRRACQDTSFSAGPRGRDINMAAMNSFFRRSSRTCVRPRRLTSDQRAGDNQEPLMRRVGLTHNIATSMRMTRVHKLLTTFCQVLAFHRRLSKRKALRTCCPRGPPRS